MGSALGVEEAQTKLSTIASLGSPYVSQNLLTNPCSSIFLFDSVNSNLTLPQEFIEALTTQGIENPDKEEVSEHNTGKIDTSKIITSVEHMQYWGDYYGPVLTSSCKVLNHSRIQIQEGGTDCGFWALYFSIMIIHESGDDNWFKNTFDRQNSYAYLNSLLKNQKDSSLRFGNTST